MSKEQMDGLLLKARILLDDEWAKNNRAGEIGLCWGSHHKGSAIVIASCSEVVVVSLGSNQQLQVKEFSAVIGGTNLGNEVNRLLASLM